jgi:P-type Ca2+ transporter type 2C
MAPGETISWPAWNRSVEECLEHYDVDEAGGLDNGQVEKQRAQFGFNELEKDPPTPLWKLVLAQFDDMLVKVRATLQCR